MIKNPAWLQWILVRWNYLYYLQERTDYIAGALAFAELREEYSDEFQRDLLKDLESIATDTQLIISEIGN